MFSSSLIPACGLECFACDEEDWNHHDCTHNRQPCDPFQDSCTTYIRFGGTVICIRPKQNIGFRSPDRLTLFSLTDSGFVIVRLEFFY